MCISEWPDNVIPLSETFALLGYIHGFINFGYFIWSLLYGLPHTSVCTVPIFPVWTVNLCNEFIKDKQIWPHEEEQHCTSVNGNWHMFIHIVWWFLTAQNDYTVCRQFHHTSRVVCLNEGIWCKLLRTEDSGLMWCECVVRWVVPDVLNAYVP
jgi:hypothetical protein